MKFSKSKGKIQISTDPQAKINAKANRDLAKAQKRVAKAQVINAKARLSRAQKAAQNIKAVGQAVATATTPAASAVTTASASSNLAYAKMGNNSDRVNTADWNNIIQGASNGQGSQNSNTKPGNSNSTTEDTGGLGAFMGEQ